MSQTTVCFESRGDVVVGVEFIKEEGDSLRVAFQIVSATDSPFLDDQDESEVLFNFLNGEEVVQSAGEATLLASGNIFGLNFLPDSHKHLNSLNYTVKMENHLYFKNEFEAIADIIQKEVLFKGGKILAGEPLEEYELTKINDDPITII